MNIKLEAHFIRRVVVGLDGDEGIKVHTEALSVFGNASPPSMAEEEQKDPLLSLVCNMCPQVKTEKKSAIAKIKSKVIRRCLLQFDWLTFKKKVHHWLYNINCVKCQ